MYLKVPHMYKGIRCVYTYLLSNLEFYLLYSSYPNLHLRAKIIQTIFIKIQTFFINIINL